MASSSSGRTSLKNWKGSSKISLNCEDCKQPQIVHSEVAKVVCSRCVSLRLNPNTRFLEEMTAEEKKAVIESLPNNTTILLDDAEEDYSEE